MPAPPGRSARRPSRLCAEANPASWLSLPAGEPYVYPKRPPLAAWNAQVPAVADEKAMKLDGNCTRAEYAQGAKLVL
jgi:hypothetical protein